MPDSAMVASTWSCSPPGGDNLPPPPPGNAPTPIILESRSGTRSASAEAKGIRMCSSSLVVQPRS
eukprot:10959464-Lingulodinium_polyedra.AAC.1